MISDKQRAVIVLNKHIRNFLINICNVTDVKIQNQYINTFCKENEKYKLPKNINTQIKKIEHFKNVFIIHNWDDWAKFAMITAGIEIDQKKIDEPKSLIDSLIRV